MPRYRFQCSHCEHIEIVFLRMAETLENCTQCNSKNCMEKVYDKFFSTTKKTKKHKIGNITKEYIEKNREILEKQKKEAESTEYESS